MVTLLQNTEVLTYQQTLSYLYSRLPVFHRIGPAALKPGLDNIEQMCQRIGNPQQTFATIHIAGTNGKGSTSHYLAAILQCAGYKTGLYTSPHVKDFRERIRLNGKMVPKNFVVSFTQNKLPLFNSIEPSFFELTVAMAFDYFARKKVDIAVIETGLGGRLDSTNIILPKLSVITNIGYDHTNLLGNTLAAIAFEKAGIIKPHIPVVIGEQHSETKAVFKTKAQLENAPIIFAEDTYTIEATTHNPTQLTVKATPVVSKKHKTYTSGLVGIYQLKNIRTVLTAIDELRKLGYDIPEKAVKQGIAQVAAITGFVGRWQILKQQPLVIADTAHNYDGLKETMFQLSKLKKRHLHLVFGVVADKDLDKILPLLPKKATYYFCKPNLERGLDVAVLQQSAAQYGLIGKAYTTCKKAYNASLKNTTPNDVIYIGGSTFVVGEIL